MNWQDRKAAIHRVNDRLGTKRREKVWAQFSEIQKTKAALQGLGDMDLESELKAIELAQWLERKIKFLLEQKKPNTQEIENLFAIWEILTTMKPKRIEYLETVQTMWGRVADYWEAQARAKSETVKRFDALYLDMEGTQAAILGMWERIYKPEAQ